MGTTLSRPRPRCGGCSRDKMMYQAAYSTKNIRASRGNYEAEVSLTGEAGLYRCLIMCDKNPGHKKFIAANVFSIEHLPRGYQDKDTWEYVRATSDVTCRLKVTSISRGRPDTWPQSDQPFPFSAHKGNIFMMTGSGWVNGVVVYTEEDNMNCTCDLCHGSATHTPMKTWGKVFVKTACHVVYDDEEARNTTCQFFDDSDEIDTCTVPTLTGLKVVDKDLEEDWSMIVYVTHDMELLNTFEKMWRHWDVLHSKVAHKYTTEDNPHLEGETNKREDTCIIVSYPHGRCKQISVGTWAQRNLVDTYNSGKEKISYRYDTPTCPGSSGAPIISLWKHNRRTGQPCDRPAHSQGGPGNDNYSGAGREWVKQSLPVIS